MKHENSIAFDETNRSYSRAYVWLLGLFGTHDLEFSINRETVSRHRFIDHLGTK